MASETVLSHAIFINNRKMLAGDIVSAKIVFNNLVGQNFRSHRNYTRYLRDMESIWKTEILLGDLVELRNLDTGKNERRQQAGTGLPESVQAKLTRPTPSLQLAGIF